MVAPIVLGSLILGGAQLYSGWQAAKDSKKKAAAAQKQAEETKTASFMSSIKKIQNVGVKINGIIINDLDTSKDSYYSYYYNYSPQYYSSTKN